MTPPDIRRLDPTEAELISTIAARMRETLIEVLGRERGEAMYSLPWLEDRVRFHLDPDLCTGEVFIAEIGGEVVGHTMVRIDDEEPEGTGLFGTTWVQPEARRAGVADRLLRAGEGWMRDHGLTAAATYTDPDNAKLIRLYSTLGYRLRPVNDEFVRLSRELTDGGFTFEVVDPASPAAQEAMRRYFEELDTRFVGGFDVAEGMAEDVTPMTEPSGRFVLVRRGEDVMGCGGVLHLEDGVAEIKRMWIAPAARGLGLGRRLLNHLEEIAAELGHELVRLDTNSVLTPAMEMYRTAGYAEIDRYNDNPYARHWFQKSLG